MRRVFSRILSIDRRWLIDFLYRLGVLNWPTASRLGGVSSRPQYHFGLDAVAREASALGITSITAIEFGVAGGKGLHELAKAAKQCSKFYGLQIQVLGFDSGKGMPASEDHRDAPYLWQQGDFSMDKNKLEKRLGTRTQIVLGPLSDSAPALSALIHTGVGIVSITELERVSNGGASLIGKSKSIELSWPVAFVSVDLDYYSSTKQALALIRNFSRLPRVWMYFDDLDYVAHKSGEWLAIDEFNAVDLSCQVSEVSLPRKPWIDWSYRLRVLHQFDSPRYLDPIRKNPELDL